MARFPNPPGSATAQKLSEISFVRNDFQKTHWLPMYMYLRNSALNSLAM